jgi:hypothetical protein
MKEISGYIIDYAQSLNKKVLLLCSLMTALLIWLNYSFDLEKLLATNTLVFWSPFTGHWLLFVFAFSLPYIFYFIIQKRNFFKDRRFVFLLIIGPAIFALKMGMNTELPFSTDWYWWSYWNQVYYWPIRLVIITTILFFIWRTFDRTQPFYGLTRRNLKWKPYWLMLLFMIPLIAAASTQPDFLAMYPKLKSVFSAEGNSRLSWWHKLLYELSYGSDFFTIEIFFRGFLVLAFLKWAGKDAILPMACFYCTIHFGKPLGECISSYFGGLLLGVIVYNTRSIWGGLMVHVGIAWLMEIGGYVGNYFYSP